VFLELYTDKVMQVMAICSAATMINNYLKGRFEKYVWIVAKQMKGLRQL
jgi:hypothetical protein